MKIKDPVSFLTHFSFSVLALPTAAVLICLAAIYGTAWHIVSLAIFGSSLFFLYTASAVYHAIPGAKTKKSQIVLRKIDHMMIFVLIAGTYTPVCLITLRGPWGYTLLAVIWTFAAGGILMKAFWMSAPRILTSGIYVVMGWAVVVAFYPLAKALPGPCMCMLILGGVFYTVGALIYAVKRPKFNLKYFGFHELFHIFVMIGTVFHIIMMFMLIWS